MIGYDVAELVYAFAWAHTKLTQSLDGHTLCLSHKLAFSIAPALLVEVISA